MKSMGPGAWGFPKDDPTDGDFSVQEGDAQLHIEVDATLDQAVIAPDDEAGNHVIITNFANRAKQHHLADPAAPTDPVFAVFSSTDVDADATQFGSLSFVAATDSFDIAAGGSVINILGSSDARFEFKGTSTNRPQLRIYGAGNQCLMLGAQTTHKQATLTVDDDCGNQLVFCNSVSDSGDAGHAVQTNPTLYIHSDQATSGGGANEWLSLHHDQTDAVITCGEGDIKFQPAGLLQRTRFVKAAIVNYNDPSPKTLLSVQDGDVVTNVWAEVTTNWDAAGTVNIGDGFANDGFATSVKLGLGATGYKLRNADDKGSYLWDSVGAHSIDMIYNAGDTIDAFITAGGDTQGVMVVYIEVVRLK